MPISLLDAAMAFVTTALTTQDITGVGLDSSAQSLIVVNSYKNNGWPISMGSSLQYFDSTLMTSLAHDMQSSEQAGWDAWGVLSGLSVSGTQNIESNHQTTNINGALAQYYMTFDRELTFLSLTTFDSTQSTFNHAGVAVSTVPVLALWIYNYRSDSTGFTSASGEDLVWSTAHLNANPSLFAVWKDVGTTGTVVFESDFITDPIYAPSALLLFEYTDPVTSEPQAPSTVSATVTTDNTILVHWNDAITGTTGDKTKIYWRRTSDIMYENAQIDIGTSQYDILTYFGTSLAPGSYEGFITHRDSVTSLESTGEGNWSATISADGIWPLLYHYYYQ